MRFFPRSAFGQTVFLIGFLLLINQLVSYFSVAFYVIKPSTQQISHLIARQVNLLLPVASLSSEEQALVSAHVQQVTGTQLFSEEQAMQQGLANASYYSYFSQQMAQELQTEAEVRISQTDNFVFWVRSAAAPEYWIRVPLAGLEETSFPLLTFYLFCFNSIATPTLHGNIQVLYHRYKPKQQTPTPPCQSMEKQHPRAQVRIPPPSFFTSHFPANFYFFNSIDMPLSTKTTYLGPQTQP